MSALTTLKERMYNGIASFTYEKKNGEIRAAHGTLDLSLVASYGGAMPKGVGNEYEGIQSYFDTDKGEWRRFNVANLISIE